MLFRKIKISLKESVNYIRKSSFIVFVCISSFFALEGTSFSIPPGGDGKKHQIKEAEEKRKAEARRKAAEERRRQILERKRQEEEAAEKRRIAVNERKRKEAEAEKEQKRKDEKLIQKYRAEAFKSKNTYEKKKLKMLQTIVDVEKEERVKREEKIKKDLQKQEEIKKDLQKQEEKEQGVQVSSFSGIKYLAKTLEKEEKALSKERRRRKEEEKEEDRVQRRAFWKKFFTPKKMSAKEFSDEMESRRRKREQVKQERKAALEQCRETMARVNKEPYDVDEYAPRLFAETEEEENHQIERSKQKVLQWLENCDREKNVLLVEQNKEQVSQEVFDPREENRKTEERRTKNRHYWEKALTQDSDPESDYSGNFVSISDPGYTLKINKAEERHRLRVKRQQQKREEQAQRQKTTARKRAKEERRREAEEERRRQQAEAKKKLEERRREAEEKRRRQGQEKRRAAEQTQAKKESKGKEQTTGVKEKKKSGRRSPIAQAETPPDYGSQHGAAAAVQACGLDQALRHISDSIDSLTVHTMGAMSGVSSSASSSLVKTGGGGVTPYLYKKNNLLQKAAQFNNTNIIFSSNTPRRIFVSFIGENKHKPKERSLGAQAGIIIKPFSQLRLGTSYSYISKDIKDYKVSTPSFFGGIKTKTTTSVLSGIAAWNVDKPGVMTYLVGAQAWGHVRTKRIFTQQGVPTNAKGKPKTTSTSVNAQLGYNFSLFEFFQLFDKEYSLFQGMLITPYLEINYIKGYWKPFKETQGTLPAEISALKNTTRETMFGIRHVWAISETLGLQTWGSYIKKKQTSSKVSSIITTRHKKYSFTIPARDNRNTEVELGMSVNIHLLKNFGTTITGSLRTKNFTSLNSERVSLGFWYDF